MSRIIPSFHHATLAPHIERLNRIFVHIPYTAFLPSMHKQVFVHAQVSKATCAYGLPLSARIQLGFVFVYKTI